MATGFRALGPGAELEASWIRKNFRKAKAIGFCVVFPNGKFNGSGVNCGSGSTGNIFFKSLKESGESLTIDLFPFFGVWAVNIFQSS